MCPPEEYRIRLLFSGEPLMIHPTVIFRRSELERNGLRYPEEPKFRFTEDYKMWVDCIRRGTAGILEEVVLKYRNAKSDHRITISHAEDMRRSGRAVQEEQFARLGITLTNETAELNLRLLAGRKPYDARYKSWMDLILEKNRAARIYSQEILERLFHERWYNITYYGIAHERSFFKRIKYFAALYPGDKTKFIKSILSRKNK